MKKLLAPLLLVLLLATCALAAPFPRSVTTPTSKQPGEVLSATEWNDSVVSLYDWLNTEIVDRLNILTAKGDLYVYDGANLNKLAVGADNTKLVSDHLQNIGIKWSSAGAFAPMTTKGDLVSLDANGNVARIPIGTNGQILTASSGYPTWQDAAIATDYPKGSVLAFSPAAYGSASIPSGWAVADGTAGTPNLIGLFVIGGRPGGSSASGASGGYGTPTADNAGTGTKTHAHSFTTDIATTSAATAHNTHNPGTANATFSTYGHTHTLPALAGSTNAATLHPADYALLYIVKLN